MQTIRVGFSRLYNANACTSMGRDEVLLPFPLGVITVEAYIGPNPRHIIGTWTVGPSQPQDPTAQKIDSSRREHVFPSPEKFPADFYVELVAVERIEVDDELASAFKSRDLPARDEILRIADDHRSSFTKALDCVAGILGLRLHYLLVTTPITEQLYAYRDDGKPYSFSTGFPLTITEAYEVDLSDKGLQSIRGKIPQLKRRWTWEKAADILAWLLRAWAAEDSVLRFVSLFIPLECVIPNVLPGEKNAWEQERSALLALIQKERQTNEPSKLSNFVAELRFPSPSIVSRFEKWAAQAALPGWAEDITAFKEFQKMRNLLVHAGQKGIEYRVTVGAKEVRTLEDIAERYVSLALFGDADVYQSRKRAISRQPN
jgi:hypothetical protein